MTIRLRIIILVLLVSWFSPAECSNPREVASVKGPVHEGSGLSGWRGGIGITFGSPATKIPDVTELGYEIAWGGEPPAYAKAMNLAVFRYVNMVVEISLKAEGKGGYDFSRMPDKDEAARLAFDAWAEAAYGVKGLSKYAQVQYAPKGNYGDVYGTMDLTSENPLVKGVIAAQIKWFSKQGIRRGGIALDNAGKVPEAFLKAMSRDLNAKGLGIATNGCPEQHLPYVDFFGNEGFPFTPAIAREYRAKGFRGILGEFALRHLSSGELAEYLKAKLFNGIVWFGYTDGDIAIRSMYSLYYCRPDVYNHHRWVLRKYVPLSRAVVAAGRQDEPFAWAKGDDKATAGNAASRPAVKTTAEGKVVEGPSDQGERTTAVHTGPTIVTRFGNDISRGVYLYVESARAETVVCDAQRLNLDGSALVFDEFDQRVLPRSLNNGHLEFAVGAGPRIVQLGVKDTIVRNILSRVDDAFRQQALQRDVDAPSSPVAPANMRPGELGYRHLKPWAGFAQGYGLDQEVARSGKRSMRAVGGVYKLVNVRYHNRQGAAQLVVINQQQPAEIVVTARSKAQGVPRSDLETITDRRHHFKCREDHAYCMHLYLDYQDGNWPDIHTVSFSPGTHDWEEKTIKVTPIKPVKTAMILLEFHQPEGTAWFDDVSLEQHTQPGRNLLGCPGFEDAEIAVEKPVENEYEKRVKSFLGMLKKSQKGPTQREQLVAMEKEIESLKVWFQKNRLERIWGRELRDINDAQEKIGVCLNMMAGNPE